MEDYQKNGLLPEILTIILVHTKLNNFWQEEKLMNLYSPVKTATMNHLASEKLENLEHSITEIVVSTRDSNYKEIHQIKLITDYLLRDEMVYALSIHSCFVCSLIEKANSVHGLCNFWFMGKKRKLKIK